MKLQGHFTIRLRDGWETYHRNGGWAINPDLPIPDSHSIDHDADGIVRERRGTSSDLGKPFRAWSESGRSGVEGEIIGVCPATGSLTIYGEVWGKTPPGGIPFVRTVTWTALPDLFRGCYYDGSIEDLRGVSADEFLVDRIYDAAFNPEP